MAKHKDEDKEVIPEVTPPFKTEVHDAPPVEEAAKLSDKTKAEMDAGREALKAAGGAGEATKEKNKE